MSRLVTKLQSDQSLRCVFADQPGHPPSLIRVFAVRSMGSQGSKLSSCGQRRLWSDWADAQADLSLRWAHNHIVGFVTWRLQWRCKGSAAITITFHPYYKQEELRRHMRTRHTIRQIDHYSLQQARWLNRGSYTSAHVLLNLLNELGEKIWCEDLPSILSVSPTSLINSIKQEHDCKILFII